MSCCGGGTYKRSRNTGQGVQVPRQQFRRSGKYARFVKQGKVPMDKTQANDGPHAEVQAVPHIYKAEEVSQPNTGEIDPSTGMAVSVLKTGRDPTNVIPAPVTQNDKPLTVIEANEGQDEDGGSESGEGESGKVTQAGE